MSVALKKPPPLRGKLEIAEKIPVRPRTGITIPRTAAAPHTGLYQAFLELPVPVVILAVWLAGAALMGSCALALYQLFWVLLGALTGG